MVDEYIYIYSHVFCIKKTGDSDLILLNDGLTINLPCKQGSQENSLGKRIFWFFNGCLCDCSMIHRIIEDPR